MRTPVHRIKSKPLVDTVEDILANALSQQYTVARQKTFMDAGKQFTAEVVLPKQKIVVEVQEKQDNKAITAEMSRERIARVSGWTIIQFSETDVRHDIDTVLYKVKLEIHRQSK